MTTRTHYSVLGVSGDASQDSIREAYRRLAREFHPDRTSTSGAGGDKMPAINEAYRILSDPARRAVYDASLRGSTLAPSNGAPATSARPTAKLSDEAMREWRYLNPVGPARIPWRPLAFFSLIVIVGIAVLAQFSKPGEPGAPDGILRTGDCVEVLPNNLVGEVLCVGEGDLVVRQFIAFDRPCSNGRAAYQDRQGMGVACIEVRPTPAG